jgi:hypothetical protein
VEGLFAITTTDDRALVDPVEMADSVDHDDLSEDAW